MDPGGILWRYQNMRPSLSVGSKNAVATIRFIIMSILSIQVNLISLTLSPIYAFAKIF